MILPMAQKKRDWEWNINVPSEEENVSWAIFVRTLHKILFFGKKEEANEIQHIQNNYFSFNTSENTYIFMYFGINEISPKFFW